ncbi:hypothetical protein ACFV1L_22160 [Kitasatospora sp. NPDC059646]|uniref:hypothetical protein n=1 Tax=Kitasatospora sp. NPDC059646 TaxID=3346893 RepID=UPI00368096B5
MTPLTRPRHPLVEEALELARDWCAGHRVDDAPALGHAVRVVLTLDRHVPAAPAEVVAAVLLHDGPEFAPAGRLDAELGRLGGEVLRIVRAMESEHQALDEFSTRPELVAEHVRALVEHDPWTLRASTADKIVAFRALLHRAARSGDAAAFFARRAALRERLPYFDRFSAAAGPDLPTAMAAELDQLLWHIVVVAGWRHGGVVPA